MEKSSWWTQKSCYGGYHSCVEKIKSTWNEKKIKNIRKKSRISEREEWKEIDEGGRNLHEEFLSGIEALWRERRGGRKEKRRRGIEFI